MRNSSDVHPFYFEFEDRYSLSEWQDWCSQRNHWPILAINLYLMSIYYGQSAMRNRKPIKIKPLLFVWNACLALFSIIGSYRSLTHMNILLPEIGFRNSVCISDPDNVVSFWVYLFTMSKFVELGDTFFLVIRKRNIMFLHWYHHVTVLLYTWFAFTHNASTGKYFIVMNYFVHSLMYTWVMICSVVVFQLSNSMIQQVLCPSNDWHQVTEICIHDHHITADPSDAGRNLHFGHLDLREINRQRLWRPYQHHLFRNPDVRIIFRPLCPVLHSSVRQESESKVRNCMFDRSRCEEDQREIHMWYHWCK